MLKYRKNIQREKMISNNMVLPSKQLYKTILFILQELQTQKNIINEDTL